MTEPKFDSKCVECDPATHFSDETDDSACEPKTNTSCPLGSGLDHPLTEPKFDSKCVECDPATHYSDKTDDSACEPKTLSSCQKGEKYTLGDNDVDSKCENCQLGVNYMDESNHKIDTCKLSQITSCGEGLGLYTTRKTDNICLPCDRSFENICDILIAKGLINSIPDCSSYLQNTLSLAADFNTMDKYNNQTDHSMCLSHGDIQCDPEHGRVDGDQDSPPSCRACSNTAELQEFSPGGVNVKCQVKKSSCPEDFTLHLSNSVTEDNRCVCENDAFHPYGNTEVCVRMTVCASDEIEVGAPQLFNSSKPWAIDNGYKTDRQCVKQCTVTAPQNGAMGDCASVIASGTSCQPTCNEGYEVSGKSTCLDTGLDAAVCTEKPCDISFLTSLLSNGDAGTCENRNSLTHGESCLSTCNNGYVELGSGSCDRGSFKIDGNVITSDSANLCVEKSCVLPELPNGDKCTNKTELNHGETCVPTCDDGYKLVGHESKQYSCSLGNLNHLECKRCPDGSYDSDKNHLTECQTKEKNCAPGKGLYKGNSFVEDDWVCKPCDNQTHGTLNQFNNKEDDQPCVAHKTYDDPTLSPNDHAEPCNAKAGYHFVDGDSENDARCEPCGKGKVSAAQDSDCTVCLPGTEQVVDAFHGDVCPDCPVGKYDHDNDPSTACQSKTQTCVEGEGLYKGDSKVADDWVCKPCDDQTHGTLNQFNDKEDDQPCVDHKTYNDPTFSPDEHADPCNARPGYHLVEGGSKKDAKCEPCAEKTFSKANESVCTPCPPNHIAPSASGSCTPCEPNETEENNVCICKLPSVLKNGVCEEQRLGCINPEATNYDSHKNTDDGSCYRHCVGSWSDCINSTQTYIKTVLKLGLGDECEAEHNAQEECIAALGTDSTNVDVLAFDNLRETIDENNKDAKRNGKSLLRQVVEKKFDLKTVKLFTNQKADVSEALRFLKDNVKADTAGADRPDKIEALKVMMPKKVEYTKSFDVSGTQEEKLNEIKRIVAERYDTVVELVQITLKGRRRLLSTYRRKLLSLDVDIVVQTDVPCQGDDSCNVVCDGYTEDGECKPLTACLPGEYEVVAPTATSDRICASTCPENIFSSNEAEHLADYTVVRLCDLCVDNYHTQAGSDTCHACPAGLITLSKIDRTLKLDTLDQCVCPSNHRVYRASDSSLKCSPCPPGYESESKPVFGSSARETSCTENPDHCEVNEHVKYHKCVACPPGVMNARGDDPAGADTECDDAHLCQENFHVQLSDAGDYECKKCPEGTFNHGGDNPKNKFETECCALGNYESVDENVRYEGSCEADSDCASNSCDTNSKLCRVQIPKICRDCGTESVDVRKTYNELSCCHHTDRTLCNKLKIDKEKHCGDKCSAARAPPAYTSAPTPAPATTTAAPSAPTQTGTKPANEECVLGSECLSGQCNYTPENPDTGDEAFGYCLGCGSMHGDGNDNPNPDNIKNCFVNSDDCLTESVDTEGNTVYLKKDSVDCVSICPTLSNAQCLTPKYAVGDCCEIIE